MFRYFALIVSFSLLAFAAEAAPSPAGQVHLVAGKTLNGRFTEQHHLSSGGAPINLSGAFTASPTGGLVWNVETPFPATTTVTRNGMVQEIGGIKVPLQIKNLKHLYDMISCALAGDWNGLEKDFVLNLTQDGNRWQMLMAPRPDHPGLSYTGVAVTGGKFVENITLTKTDGGFDNFAFSDVILTP